MQAGSARFAEEDLFLLARVTFTLHTGYRTTGAGIQAPSVAHVILQEYRIPIEMMVIAFCQTSLLNVIRSFLYI